jgi:tripartite-type tricarboxylate transporter receptor subunit TctC
MVAEGGSRVHSLQLKIVSGLRTGLAATIATFGFAFSAAAQEYPARPVRMIVPFPPGGGTDFFARILAQKLNESLGVTFVVDNRPGAGGIVGTDLAAKAKPDGYTIVLVSTSHAINPSLHRKLPFDPARDFSPVTMLASGPLLLVVHPSLPARNVRDLIAIAKARPGMLTVASAGNGTPPHLACELFKTLTGVDMVHVPYKGNGPAYVDLVAGQVSVMFPSIATALPIVKGGKLRPLAVTSANRSRIAPELPTIAEGGVPGYELSSWYGLLAPAGTPTAIVSKLQQEVSKFFKGAELMEKLLSQGVEPLANLPDEFAAALTAEIAKWNKLARAAGIPQQ